MPGTPQVTLLEAGKWRIGEGRAARPLADTRVRQEVTVTRARIPDGDQDGLVSWKLGRCISFSPSRSRLG
jgi:hypothetical protein